jgi:hypothetical protein
MNCRRLGVNVVVSQFFLPPVPGSERLSVRLTSTATLQLSLNVEKVHMYCLKG